MDSEPNHKFRSIPSELMPAARLGSSQPVRRFDGLRRTSTRWDGLRRDNELWLKDGSYFVHLYGRGSSKRGPSIKIPFYAVQQAASSYLLDHCEERMNQSESQCSEDDSSDSGYATSIIDNATSKAANMFVPAPTSLTRDQTFRYHLTSRNFFAYILGKPLVGTNLGTALVELWQRVQEWQPPATSVHFLGYCRQQGYLDLAEHPDCALACLHFANEARMSDLWIDAFVHCVGMHDSLDSSSEFFAMSSSVKASIVRAASETSLHLTRVTRSLAWFLDEELGPSQLGLSKPARDHLDRFRSFLRTFYVTQTGYFPPDENEAWDKQLWFMMYNDFRNLYEFLADSESTAEEPNGARDADGGVCVAQNVRAFDERHGFLPLPHPLPLLPEMPPVKGDASKRRSGLRLRRTNVARESTIATRHALLAATNSSNDDVLTNPLVMAYTRFERGRLEEKLSTTEARKIRWLLVYGVLQMVVSITCAPKEVSDTETPSYPLCVLTTGCPPWNSEPNQSPSAPSGEAMAQAGVDVERSLDNVDTGRIAVYPDCEARNARDFFSTNNMLRTNSLQFSDMTPLPLRITTQLSRTASLRSSVRSTIAGSVSKRNSWSMSSSSLARGLSSLGPRSSHAEILLEGYGNGSTPHEGLSRSTTPQPRYQPSPLVSQEVAVAPVTETTFVAELEGTPISVLQANSSSDEATASLLNALRHGAHAKIPTSEFYRLVYPAAQYSNEQRALPPKTAYKATDVDDCASPSSPSSFCSTPTTSRPKHSSSCSSSSSLHSSLCHSPSTDISSWSSDIEHALAQKKDATLVAGPSSRIPSATVTTLVDSVGTKASPRSSHASHPFLQPRAATHSQLSIASGSSSIYSCAPDGKSYNHADNEDDDDDDDDDEDPATVHPLKTRLTGEFACPDNLEDFHDMSGWRGRSRVGGDEYDDCCCVELLN